MMVTVIQNLKPIDDGPQPIRGEWGASILGPRNLPLERENHACDEEPLPCPEDDERVDPHGLP